MTTATDPTQPGLLRDVLEHPREDGPRLVYADWCEDNRLEDSAVLIREQVRVRRRFSQEISHVWNWESGLSGLAHPGPFVSEARLPLQAFLDHAETLFALHPIERVVLTDREPHHNRWDATSTGPAGIPRTIFRFLSRGEPARYRPDSLRYYESAGLAKEDLSRACVRYGRGLHRLPPIDFEN